MLRGNDLRVVVQAERIIDDVQKEISARLGERAVAVLGARNGGLQEEKEDRAGRRHRRRIVDVRRQRDASLLTFCSFSADTK